MLSNFETETQLAINKKLYADGVISEDIYKAANQILIGRLYNTKGRA